MSVLYPHVCINDRVFISPACPWIIRWRLVLPYCRYFFRHPIGDMHLISLQTRIFARRFHRWIGIWMLCPTDPPSPVTFSTVDPLRGDRSDKYRFFGRFAHTPLAFEREKNIAPQVSHYCVIYRSTRNWMLFWPWKFVGCWTSMKNSTAKRSAETTLKIGVFRRFSTFKPKIRLLGVILVGRGSGRPPPRGCGYRMEPKWGLRLDVPGDAGHR